MIREGYKFKTNIGMNCVVLYNQFINEYMIVYEDLYIVIASDKCELIEKLVETVRHKF